MRMKFMKLPLAMFTLGTALVSPFAHALYKCVDEKGITHYGDTMPPQCAKKAITEMTKQGDVVRKYDAPLTPEQLRAQDEERERRAEQEKKITEQRLKDQALIATYGSEREFNVARDKDLAGLDARKKTLIARNEDIDKQLSKTQNEMEFYKAGKSKAGKAGKTAEAPPQLVMDYNRAKNDRTLLDNELVKVDVDRAAVVARYDAEKERWKKLKGGMAAGTLINEKGDVAAAPDLPTQIVGQSTLIPGRPRGTATCEGKTYECSLGLQYLCRAPNVGGPGVNVKLVSCLDSRR
jgi:hypothetical protein